MHFLSFVGHNYVPLYPYGYIIIQSECIDINDCLIISLLLIFHIVTLLLPLRLSSVCSGSWSSSLKACKPFLFIKQTVYFLLDDLLSVRLDHDTSGTFILLPDLDLLFFVGVYPSLLLLNWRVSWLLVMRETRVAWLETWFFYFYFLQVLKEHFLSF